MPTAYSRNVSRGVTFASLQALGLSAVAPTAALTREYGYRSFWTAEVNGPEAFTTLAIAHGAAPELDLGTGVIALQLRTPPLAAMAAATLQALAGDREIYLGIGVSSPVVAGKWHGADYSDRPLAHTREYLTLLRMCLSGERVDFAGDFYSIRGFRLGVRLPRTPKIVLGALGPRMLRLGAELADGVLLNYLPASHVGSAIAAVRESATAAATSPEVFAYVHVGVCDPEPAREFARKDLFSYAVVPSYAENFRAAGFGEEVDAINAAHAKGDRAGALAAVSDRMCDAIDITGDSAHIAAAVASYEAAGVDHAILMPLPWGQNRSAVLEATLSAAAPTESSAAGR